MVFGPTTRARAVTGLALCVYIGKLDNLAYSSCTLDMLLDTADSPTNITPSVLPTLLKATYTVHLQYTQFALGYA